MREALSNALKDAMRAKDKIATATLRLVLAALKDRDIAARTAGDRGGIEDAHILSMLHTMVKQRHDSIAMYEQGERPELAQRERAEIAIIERFLPRQLDDAEIEAAVVGVIEETGADYVISNDPTCLMQLRGVAEKGGKQQQFLHLAEVLYSR